MPQREFHKILNLIAISGIISLFSMLIISSCDDSPTRPGFVRPECWKPLVNNDEVAGYAEGAPAWSHDGSQVAYSSDYDTCNNFGPEIVITDQFGLTKRAIGIVGAYIRWLPGDSELVISVGRSGGQLVIFNLNTEEVTPLGIFTRFPQFDVTSDGRFIFYEREPLTRDSIAVIDRYEIQTGKSVPIVIGGGPAISRNGEKLLYSFGGQFVLNLDDSSTLQVVDGRSSNWLKGDTSFVYDNGFGEICVSDLRGNSKCLIGKAGPEGAFGPIDVSPDGRTILFNNYTSDDFHHIWRMNTDGSRALKFLAW